MELTKKQFDMLVSLTSAKLSQRELEEKTGYSLGTVNKAVRELSELGYICDGIVTEAGANVIVAGSSIFGAKKTGAVIKQMREEAAKHPYNG